MTTFTKSGLAAAMLAVFAYLPLHANAALFDDDEARKAILDLRAKVEAMRNELGGRIDTKADKSSTLDLVNQHEGTMAEIAKLRGQIEVLANEIANTQKRQKDFYLDLDARIRKLEPRQVNIDGKEAAVDPAEQKAYDAALLLFKAGDYKNAGLALGDFVRMYPESGYAANAQYWLGNSHYALKDCKAAILAQQVVVKAYPDSPRAADALLNIASCQTELKALPNAKKTLNELISKYPDSEAAATAKERLKAK
ncbi:tol-pal system protein YbgF [Pseudoduganella namucuonensis]|uniref:Cell division coordinator CpoB n=1 Tax=Pseudoduganella namucuonensis TaxID=1035707 RepID=A0A1I7KVZ5_9BURK|nr:tol-pal system protein YbgF [Pseudoduganella namucuonensis]SFV01619.1 tol-pal system protein YbgF [Pseudoduganella namucuonensis]